MENKDFGQTDFIFDACVYKVKFESEKRGHNC